MDEHEPKGSSTYKFRTSDERSKHAFYFTIVGGKEPIWFFLNTKDVTAVRSVDALMTAYSKLVQSGTSIHEIIKYMKDTFDNGGFYFAKIKDGSVKVNSIVHHLGLILESHVRKEQGYLS